MSIKRKIRNQMIQQKFDDAKAIAEMNDRIEKVAENVLGIDTLETQNNDQQDFHEISVWELKEALQAAYEAGRISKDKE